MTTSQHIAVSSLLGSLLNIPLIGLIVGFISHAMLDSIEPQEYKITLKNKKMILLEFILSILMISALWGNIVILYAIIGGILPDIIDGILSVIDKERYMKGKHLFWFHDSNGNEKTLSKKETIIISIILFFLVI